MSLNKAEHIRSLLAQIADPLLGSNLVSLKMVKRIEESHDGALNVTIELPYPAKTKGPELEKAIREVFTRENIADVHITLKQAIIHHKVQPTLKVYPWIRNIIAVSSGKGGVGKSTVATNLAAALQLEGAKVGILDADIYGPSVPKMLGSSGQPYTLDGEKMEPFEAHGLQVMSIGYHVGEDDPMIWRGPMASSALKQLVEETNWTDLDYLIVDMPPGTGDIQLTMSQQIPLTAAIVVSTPQDIALIDAKKGLSMFKKTNVAILGIVENMSTFICPCCGESTAIFGSGGARKMSEDYGVPLLAELPLSPRIREQADAGTPMVMAEPESAEANVYRDAALAIAASIAKLPKDFSLIMPGVKVVGK